MFYTKAKVIDRVAKVKLEQFLEDLYEEAMQLQDTERELLLLGAYFVGCESLTKNTFMVIEDKELPQKYIVVPGIPYEITEAWAY